MLKKKSNLIILFILLTNFVTSKLQAQNVVYNNSEDTTSVLAQDSKHFVEVGFGLLAAPFSFDWQDWAGVGFTVGGTALLFTADKSVKDFALRNHNKLNDAVFNMDSFYGNHYTALLALGIYGYGALSGNDVVRKTGLYAIEAFMYSGIITGALKVFIGRRRPYAGDGHLFFKPFQFSNSDYQALPSGHATVSFAVSTVLAKSLDNTYWKVFWYGTAGMVAASRVYHSKHWVSDVFLGSVIGYAVGDYVVNFDKKEELRLFGKKIKPYIDFNRVGICIYLN